MDASCHSVSKNLKKVLNKNQSDSSNILLFDHQISKNNHSLATGIMNSKGIYPMYISSKGNILTSRIYFEKKKNFLSRDFNGRTYKNFLANLL